MSFRVTPTDIADVLLVHTPRHADARGALMELVRETELTDKGLPRFVQCNHSRSCRNVLRGLHYQVGPHAQAKLVRCLNGRIFDVAVDLRPGSASFGRWVGVDLDGESETMLFIPAGFAHGFCVLSDQADVIYWMDREYAPGFDRNIVWNDPTLAITWPIDAPLLSERDQNAPLLTAVDR